MKPYAILFLPVLLFCRCGPEEQPQPTYNTLFPGKPTTPAAILEEHDSLLAQIHRMTAFPDSAGRKAKKLEEILQQHFQEEEDYVLPTLGLLPSLASGQTPPASKEVIGLTEKFRSQLTHMSVEHQLIVAFIDEMKQAPASAPHPEIAAFEKALLAHAKNEEDIYFPAALLAGDYLKLTTAKAKH